MNASQASLEILYEDDVLLAVNKPAGLVVHPTYKNAAGTLLDVLRGGDPADRFFLAGRLDRLTSGVVDRREEPGRVRVDPAGMA